MVQEFLFKYAPFVLFIPLLISIWYYRQYTSALKYITIYLVVSAATQILSLILWFHSKNNLPLLHIFTLVEFLLLLKFYYYILNDFTGKVLFVVLAVCTPLFFIIDSAFIESIYTYNTYARSIEALVFIFLSMAWFVKIVSVKVQDHTLQKTLKYFNSGLLVYFSGSVILFSYANSVSLFGRSLSLNVWSLHTLLAVILYLLLAIGLWNYRKH